MMRPTCRAARRTSALPRRAAAVLALLVATMPAATVHAQTPAAGATRPAPPTATAPAPGSAQATAAPPSAPPTLDPEAATRAYLATVPAAERARSDAYFEGGYWIALWGTLITIGVMLLVLARGWSRAMRDRAERWTSSRSLQVFLYWAQFLVLTTLITLPWTIYAGFLREKRYGLATQTFGAWLGDQGKGFLVGLLFGGATVVALYAVARRAPRTWPVWGAATALVLSAFGILLFPVYILPLFNRVEPLTDPRVRDPILALARANGIEAHDVFVVDASRQSTRISANVSGIFGTQRITLNDNLLRRGTLPEIRAVMGHEMGHYVLHHVYESLVFMLVVIVVAFALLRWAFDRAQARWGERWGVRGIADPAGLPLVALILAAFGYLMTPVMNTYVRSNEAEADIFGVNAAREPDGFATISLKLGEYRKLAPGPVEEFLFYDHPSGRTRILMAMRWKAEHAGEPLPR
ncbi:MAG TPA: M48 family metallopeptidase [Longimicrobiales bacterium]|nr:M48 family metallopeptidase [Longimicrobiales bacterium]